jgi:hypothetical protein
MAREQLTPGATDHPTVLGVVQLLLAGTAVAGAVIYVLMNALYIEFYDDFGVRPEEVGLDRLAILGRAGVLAITALVLTAPIVFGITWVYVRRRFHASHEALVPPARKSKDEGRNSKEETGSQPEQYKASTASPEAQAKSPKTRAWLQISLGITALIGIISILFTFTKNPDDGGGQNGVGLSMPRGTGHSILRPFETRCCKHQGALR